MDGYEALEDQLTVNLGESHLISRGELEELLGPEYFFTPQVRPRQFFSVDPCPDYFFVNGNTTVIPGKCVEEFRIWPLGYFLNYQHPYFY